MPTKLDKFTDTCSSCEQKFKHGDTCTSLLCKHADSWQRKNLCNECLEKTDLEYDAMWKIHIDKKNKKVVLSETAIWQFLKKASEDEDMCLKPLSFILALMMARKRKLRMVKSTKVKGREFQNFVNISRKIDLKVQVPFIGPADFNKLQNEIDDFFSGGE